MRVRSTLVSVACALAVTFAGFNLARAGSAHDNARQIDGNPPTFYWAVIIGVSDYAGRTKDLPGSANDARALRDHLKRLGWRDDHIYLITDRAATRDGILRAIRWLASKTNNRSAAIFHYSGHEQPNYRDPDRDRERVDPQIRAHDNRFIIDSELARELNRVKAHRFWLDFSLCRAGGFNESGIRGPNRVVTYSSQETELSYEDGRLRHSIFSYFQIREALINRKGDWNRDGKISVEEAFWWSRIPTQQYSNNRQHPFIWDGLNGDFSITPPAPPSQRPPQPPQTQTPSPTPTQSSSPTPDPTPSSSPTPDPTPSSSPSPTPSPTPTTEPTPSPSPTPSTTPAPTPVPVPTKTCVGGVCT